MRAYGIPPVTDDTIRTDGHATMVDVVRFDDVFESPRVWVYRTGVYAAVTAVVMAEMVVMGDAHGSDFHPLQLVVFFLLCLPFLPALELMLRSALGLWSQRVLEISADGLLIRGGHRERRIRWDELLGVTGTESAVAMETPDGFVRIAGTRPETNRWLATCLENARHGAPPFGDSEDVPHSLRNIGKHREGGTS